MTWILNKYSPGSDQETSSDSKTLQSKLLINNADITEDTEIVCSYDSNHVSTVTTLDVIGTIFLIVPGVISQLSPNDF